MSSVMLLDIQCYDLQMLWEYVHSINIVGKNYLAQSSTSSADLGVERSQVAVFWLPLGATTTLPIFYTYLKVIFVGK